MRSNFNDLKNENMKFETAKEYIEYIDEQSGQSWSDSTDEIADVMEDYAKMYHERQLKLLGIANVEWQSEQLCQTCNGTKKLYDKVFGIKTDCPDY